MMNNARYALLIPVIASSLLLASCGSEEPEVTREDFDNAIATIRRDLDSAVATMEAEVDSIGSAVADIRKTVEESAGNDSDAVSKRSFQDSMAGLNSQIAALGRAIAEDDENGPEPVVAEDVFPDIFQNATRVDRVSIDDLLNCRVASQYELKLGDTASVEVTLARKEDHSSYPLSYRPYFTLIRDKSGDGVLGNDVSMERSRIELVVQHH